MNSTNASNVTEDFTNCLLDSPELYEDLSQISVIKYAIISVWSAMTVVTLIGNLLVILTIACNKSMQTITNYYILNLGVTDFLIALVVMPLKLLELTGTCLVNRIVFTTISCAIVSYILMVLVFTSLLTLVVISIERFFAIVFPLNSRMFQSRSRTMTYIAFTWIIPAVFALPQAITMDIYPYHYQSEMGSQRSQMCMENMPEKFRYSYVLTAFVLLFVVPLLLIATSSAWIIAVLIRPVNVLNQEDRRMTVHRGTSTASQETAVTPRTSVARKEVNKRKVASMIMMVALVYFVSWTPWFMTNLVGLFNPSLFSKNFFFQRLILHLVAFINSAGNPIIYYLMSEKFRSGFQKIVTSLLQCRCSRKAFSIDMSFATRSQHLYSTSGVTTHSTMHYSRKSRLPNGQIPMAQIQMSTRSTEVPLLQVNGIETENEE